MKRTALAVGLAALFSLASCGKDITKDMEALADRACACEDADCARAVLDDLAKLAEENENAKGDQDKVNASGQKLSQCVVEKGVTLEELQKTLVKLAE